MLRIRYSFKKCVYICFFIDSVIYSIDEEGDIKPLFKIAYSKPNKRFVAKSVKEKKSWPRKVHAQEDLKARELW